MTLRTRLLASSIVIAVPLAVVLFVIDERMRLTAMEENVRQFVNAELASDVKARCTANPARIGLEPPRGRGLPPPGGPGFGPLPDDPEGRGPGGRRGGPGRGGPGRPGGPGVYELFAYAADGTPARAGAPPLPATETSTYWVGEGRGVAVVVPLGGEGPCATLLVRMRPREGQFRDQVVALALVVLSVVAGAALAAGPLIARMRRLGLGVRHAAASHYEQPVAVEGSDEVAALARAFNDAGAEVRTHLVAVEARERTLRQFVANTTHDVAVPLTVLQGHLSDVVTRLGDGHPAEPHIRSAIQEAHYMGSLLRNLDTATKLGDAAAPLDLRPADLNALIERVTVRHSPIARACGVEINFAVPETPVVITADLTLLEQAIGNLIDNAIRYNVAGGHVAVVLDRTALGFCCSVADDGPGVSDAEMADLTNRWFRGSEARTRRPDGKGLGLAIATEAVERLGFTLAFRRSSDGGLMAEICGQTAQKN